MKSLIFFGSVLLVFGACDKLQVNQPAKQTVTDSLRVKELEQKDSSIMAYIKTINMIHGSIDTLMEDAKILKLKGEAVPNTNSIIDEIRGIDAAMIRNNRTLANLKMQLKKSDIKNQELVDLGEDLSKELNEKDSEIVAMQRELTTTKASLSDLSKQFKDSINIINQQRTEITVMKTEGNKVYYLVGTNEELKKQGIITTEGGVIGLGTIPVLNGSAASSGFTIADYTTLHSIGFSGYFVKMVTVHPINSYRISGGAPGKIIITDPEDFWSKSKYMVAIIK
jgi:hypothetical protein